MAYWTPVGDGIVSGLGVSTTKISFDSERLRGTSGILVTSDGTGIGPPDGFSFEKPLESERSSVEWYTPDWVIERARQTLGEIDLDPCTTESVNTRIGASLYYTAEDDGLVQPWFGKIWLNPPYSRGEIEKFVTKFSFSVDSIDAALILVNNATETLWFQRLLDLCPMVGFFNSRIAFLREDGEFKKPMQGQAIFYYGKETERFVKSFQEVSRIVVSVRWMDA